MKVGILTFHHGYNFGGFLQVYSLFKFIESLGHEVKIINYINPIHKKEKLRSVYWSKSIFNIYSNYKKKNIFNAAHSLLPLTIEVNDIKNLNESFDFVYLGSDEIWNFKNPMFGKDLTYFGKDIKSTKIASYGASFGTRSKEKKLDKDIVEQLKKIDFISVRDLNSFEIVNSIGCKSEIVLDPTFLINPNIYSNNIKMDGDYIIFYGFVIDDNAIKNLKIFAKNNNLKILSLGYKNKWCDTNILDISPFQWSEYIKRARYVITSMFHGLVYSLIHKKQFVFIMNDYRKYKVDYLVKNLVLHRSIYRVGEGSIVKKLLNHNIYNEIDPNLMKMMEKSKKNITQQIE